MAQEVKQPPVILLPLEIAEEIKSLLDKNEIGELFDAVLEYAITKKTVNFSDRTLKLIYSRLKKINDENLKKYQKICERNKINASKKCQITELQTEENVEITRKNVNRYEQKRVEATGNQSYPVAPSGSQSEQIKNKIKIKNKNKIKNKTKIENKNKNIKEKNIFLKKESADALPKKNYSLSSILSLGEEMGIDEECCKKFFEYYDSVGWVTVRDEPIKNIKTALRIWYSKEDKNKKTKVVKRRTEDDIQRIFGSI